MFADILRFYLETQCFCQVNLKLCRQYAVLGFADWKLECTEIHKVTPHCDSRSLIMARAIKLYFMSHVLRSALYTWRIKYSLFARFIDNDRLYAQSCYVNFAYIVHMDPYNKKVSHKICL